jgi:hypothetical protein
MRICQVCGKTIEKSSKAKKYCSPECRAKVKYLKDRAWLAEHPESPRNTPVTGTQKTRRPANGRKTRNTDRNVFKNFRRRQYNG